MNAEGIYSADWHSDKANGSLPGVVYRVSVRILKTPLGFTDVVADGRTIPVKFRIPSGAVHVIQPPALGDPPAVISTADTSVRMSIPAGALSEPTAITVSSAVIPASAVTAIIGGTAFEFGPSGTVFGVPIVASLGYDPARLPSGHAAASLRLVTLVDGHWRAVAGSTVDVVAHRITAPLQHFSTYAIQSLSQLAITIQNLGLASSAADQTEVYLIYEDGAGLHRLTAGQRPAWSPDGTRLAFVINGSPDPYGGGTASSIGVITLAAPTSVTVLPGTQNATAMAGAPLAWSPDGTTIAFEQSWQIGVVKADGSSPASILTGQYSNTPVWSSDGQTILFAAGYAGVTQLFTISPSGQQLQQFTDIPVDDKWPAPGSFDGKSVIFTGGTLNPTDLNLVYPQYIDRYDAITRSTTRLIDGLQSPFAKAYSMYPQVTPDRSRLYFYSYGLGDVSQVGIWTMNIDGTGLRRIIDANAVTGSSAFPSGASLQSIASWQP